MEKSRKVDLLKVFLMKLFDLQELLSGTIVHGNLYIDVNYLY